MFPIRSDSLAGPRWLAVVNNSGEEMPAGAAVVVDSSGDEGQFTISKPTTDGQQVWIAGPLTAAGNGDFAQATNDFPAWALYDDADGTPAIGEMWGAKAGSWKLRKGKAGFRICGTADTTQTLVQVERFVVAKTGTVGDCAKRWSRIPSCGTLTTREQEGACGCVPSQSVSLVKDASGNLVSAAGAYLYGCPPGVVTADCPNGAPSKFNMTVAGFTGGSTGYNGNWTLSYIGLISGVMRWRQTKGGVTWTLTGGSGGPWQLLGDDGVSAPTYDSGAVAAGCCASRTMALDDSGGADTPPASLTVTPATACGKGPAYTPVLSRTVSDCGVCLKLKWVPVAGSGARSIEFQVVECGTDSSGSSYIDFATDDPLLCTDAATECGVNSFVCRVTCGPCPCVICEEGIDWSGAGYYTVNGQCCVYYDTDPGSSVVLCDGPFASQEACELVYLPCCPTTGIPRTLCAKIVSPDCGIVEGGQYSTIPLTYDYTDGFWKGGYVYGTGVDFGNPGYMYAVTLSIVCDGPGMWHWAIGGSRNCYGGSVCSFSAISASMACADLIGSTASSTFPPLSCGADCPGGPNSICDGTDFTVTLSDEVCQENPPPPSYICVDGSCVEVFDGSGSSYADCLAVCSGGTSGDCTTCTLGTSTATLVCGFGTFTAAWNEDDPTSHNVEFTDPGSFVGTIRIDCNPFGCTLGLYVDGVLTCSLLATNVTCGPPVVFTFPGSCTGGGTCTVTT